MSVRWTSKAHLDLVRLHAFVAAVNPTAAVGVVEMVIAGVRRIATHPRIGSRLPEFASREVRRIVVG